MSQHTPEMKEPEPPAVSKASEQGEVRGAESWQIALDRQIALDNGLTINSASAANLSNRDQDDFISAVQQQVAVAMRELEQVINSFKGDIPPSLLAAKASLGQYSTVTNLQDAVQAVSVAQSARSTAAAEEGSQIHQALGSAVTGLATVAGVAGKVLVSGANQFAHLAGLDSVIESIHKSGWLPENLKIEALSQDNYFTATMSALTTPARLLGQAAGPKVG
mgnify:CR=1 FL=1